LTASALRWGRFILTYRVAVLIGPKSNQIQNVGAMRNILTLSTFVLFSIFSAAQAEITVVDAYARASTPISKTGAIFLQIENEGFEDDQLISVTSPVSKKALLHTHKVEGDIMKMVHFMGGFPVPAGEGARLQRGGDHIMLMGLTGPLLQDATFTATLVFEKAGPIEVEVVVDLHRKPMAQMEHGSEDTDDN
jgi:copper(I)-binding protein